MTQPAPGWRRVDDNLLPKEQNATPFAFRQTGDIFKRRLKYPLLNQAGAVPLYPLFFQPVRVPADWAGALLPDFRGEPAGGEAAAESWEVIDAGRLQSVIANGPLQGRTLGELTAERPGELVGRRQRRGEPFPVCLRLLDVGLHLPLLVHPDEHLCAASQGALQPNVKFWYCLGARAGAELMVGIGGRVTGLQLQQRLNTYELRELLQVFPALAGDSYLIPNGRLHSAGAGTLIWELAQRPAPPLEVSAWQTAAAPPPDEQALALRAVHIEDRQVSRICRETAATTRTRKLPLVHHCPFFVVDEIRISDHYSDRTDGGSFHLLSVVRGEIDLVTDLGVERLRQGVTCCIPAVFGNYRCAATGEPASVLRVRQQSLK